jgi:hypothetical protein
MTVVATAEVNGRSNLGSIIADIGTLNGNLTVMQRVGNSASGSVGGLGSSFGMLRTALGALGLATTISELAGLGRASYDMSVEAERASIALEIVSGSADQAALNMALAGHATRGMASDLEVAAAATKALQLGYGDTAEELEKFMFSATTMGKAMRGLDAEASIDLFNRMLSNRSVRLLDDFGISITEVNQRLREMGTNSTEAWQSVVLDIAYEKAQAMEPVLDSTGGAWDRLAARAKNSMINVGNAIGSVVNPAVDAIDKAYSDYDKMLLDTARMSESFEEFYAKAREADVFGGRHRRIGEEEDRELARQQYEELMVAVEAERELARSIQEGENWDKLNKYWRDYQDMNPGATIEETASAWANAATALQTYAAELQHQAGLNTTALMNIGGLAGEDSTGESQFSATVELMNQANLSATQYNQMLQELGLSTGVLTEQQVAAADTSQALFNLWNSGAISADAYVAGLNNVAAGMDAVKVATDAINAAAAESLGGHTYMGGIGEQMATAAESAAAQAASGMSASMADIQAQFAEFQELFNSMPEDLQIEFATNAQEAMSEVDDLAASLGVVSGMRPAPITFASNAAAARGQVSELTAAILALPAEKTVRIRIVQSGSVPNIPGDAYASGGTNVPGGIALVGEEGPELVNLPAGSDVIPNNQIGSFMNGGGMTAVGGGGGTSIYGDIVLPNVLDVTDFARELEKELKRRGKGFPEIRI